MSKTNRFQLKTAAAVLFLASCLGSVPAFSQEIIKWVDEDGVTHYGQPATATRQAVRDHQQDKTSPGERTRAAELAESTVSVEAELDQFTKQTVQYTHHELEL